MNLELTYLELTCGIGLFMKNEQENKFIDHLALFYIFFQCGLTLKDTVPIL